MKTNHESQIEMLELILFNDFENEGAKKRIFEASTDKGHEYAEYLMNRFENLGWCDELKDDVLRTGRQVFTVGALYEAVEHLYDYYRAFPG